MCFCISYMLRYVLKKYSYQLGEALSVGQPLWCVVKIKNKSGLKSGEARTVNVTIDPADVKKAFVRFFFHFFFQIQVPLFQIYLRLSNLLWISFSPFVLNQINFSLICFSFNA